MKFYRFLIKIATVLGLTVFLSSCGPNAQSSAVLGGLIGAGTGAIIGNQSGDAAKGALLGGALGAGTGALLGDKKDKKNATEQQRYQNARY
ncbi:MAG: glycine zipper domain-containing protein [Verrucomicrobiota bacterium]|nr:glycine zipper domain-containing protein [Verrucomicrobiota bacterium]MEC7637838.1 glycine zipper domain-containing protein [Verrucomicrobiota bacterium]